MKYEARGICPNCQKEIVRFWKAQQGRLDLEEMVASVECPYCLASKVALTISEVESLPRFNLRSAP